MTVLMVSSLGVAAVALLWARRSESRADRLQKELEDRESVRVSSQCLGCTHDGLLVTSAEGVVVESNPAAEHILETPSLKLKGKDIRCLFPLADLYDDLVRQADAEGRINNRSVLVLSGTGRKKLVMLSLARSGAGESARIIHSFQDCADLRTMEERLLQAERLATVGKFASQIAHEIRNPLSSISLNCELLEDEVRNGNDEAQRLIRTVMRELERMNDIVAEYLQFSRFPKPHLTKATVDVVIRELEEQFQRNDRIRLTVNLAQPSPEVWVDDTLLKQALQNLVRNAAEAIEGTGEIRIETEKIDRFLAIRVHDTGRGIPQDVVPRLFEPFFTTKGQGTGLGLATTQQIIFEHNGHIQVESQPGQGTTFTTFLPL